MSIYTKTGDTGETRLLFGGKVPKTDPRCEAYGATDEAVSAMGLARSFSQHTCVKEILFSVQKDMFIVGAELATDHNEYENLRNNYAVITSEMVCKLENLIDGLSEEFDLPDKFIIPGASPASSCLDLARSLLRTGERRVVALNQRGLLHNVEVLRYLNRLSDLLFMLARYEDKDLPFEILTGEE